MSQEEKPVQPKATPLSQPPQVSETAVPISFPWIAIYADPTSKLIVLYNIGDTEQEALQGIPPGAAHFSLCINEPPPALHQRLMTWLQSVGAPPQMAQQLMQKIVSDLSPKPESQ
jgi:hypothetical protein